jgi:glycosyltransferase involved in cell wall biosynthesis
VTRHALTYAAITPARNEAENLRRLASCIARQRVVPLRWIIVDNGSSDGTSELLTELAARYEYVRRGEVPNAETKPGAPVVRALNAGIALLDVAPDVIVKLDADVSFGEAYFEGILDAFASDESLGIASGVCFEQEDGRWRPVHVTGDHVRGATRCYRTACFDALGPLPEEMGWDGVDELKAAVLGWRTRSIDGLRFNHHRYVGQRDGARTARWLAEGRCAYYMGYRPSYLLARTIGRAIRDRDLAAFAMPYEFARCALRRRSRYEDERVRRYLREQQSLRHLPLRLRESFAGRRAE